MPILWSSQMLGELVTETRYTSPVTQPLEPQNFNIPVSRITALPMEMSQNSSPGVLITGN